MGKQQDVKVTRNDGGKMNEVFIAPHLAANANYMRKNNLYENKEVELPPVSQVAKKDNSAEREAELTALGFTVDKEGDFISPDGLTIERKEAIPMLSQAKWDKSITAYKEKFASEGEQTEEAENEEETPKKSTGRPKKK